MAYTTGGSGGTLPDLMDALRTFCAGLGWTVDKYDVANKVLFMHKGLCCITMWWGDPATVGIWSGPNNGGIFTNTPVGRIWMALTDGNDASRNVYWGHPGSVVTFSGDGDSCMQEGLVGNFVGWHFFADPTVSDHVHVVVQTGPEIFQHFSFGHVDKKGLTHSGVAYAASARSIYYRNVNQYNPSPNGSYNRPSVQPLTFLRNSDFQLRNSDAWPAAWNAAGVDIVGLNGSFPHFGTVQQLYDAFDSPNDFPSSGSAGNRLLDLLVISEATPYSNIIPLHPLPAFRAYSNSSDSTLNRVCYLGDFPNVRAANMRNMLPGQEITLGADTYKVFPCVRQENWELTGIADKVSSGQIAIAYKKVP